MVTKVTAGMRTLDALEVLASNIAAGAIMGSKIAMGSDARGDILFRNATKYARLAAGTAKQALLTGGSGADPSYGYRGWHPIQQITGVGAYEFVGMGSIFRTYKIAGWLQPSLDDKELWLRTSADAFGTAADSGASDYGYTFDGALSTSLQGRHDALNSEIIIGGLSGASRAVGNASTEGIEFEVQFSAPDDAARHKLFKFNSVWLDGTGVLATVNGGGGAKFAIEAITGVELTFEGAAPAAGDVTLYGLVDV